MNNFLHKSRINDVLHYIHSDLNRDLTAKALAKIANYSEQHFHRVFKEHVGDSINQYVRKMRLEASANQLMFAPDKTVLEIATKCGFQSLSSFSQAFKKHFHSSPGNWRATQKHHNKPPYLLDNEIAAAYKKLATTELPEVEFVQLPPRNVAYIRHTGYSRTIKRTWQILNAWAMTHNLLHNNQLGLHHSNPTQIRLEDCRYVACIEIDNPLTKTGLINSMVIPGGLHAKFEFEGVYGELLPSISKVLEQWLPGTGLIAGTTPAFVIYHKNHFLSKDEQYQLSFFLPVSFY
jgi:AraC family transcriptional regulator